MLRRVALVSQQPVNSKSDRGSCRKESNACSGFAAFSLSHSVDVPLLFRFGRMCLFLQVQVGTLLGLCWTI